MIPASNPQAVLELIAALEGAVEALSVIAEGRTPPEQEGHYTAHRAAVKTAREALASIAKIGTKPQAEGGESPTPTITPGEAETL